MNDRIVVVRLTPGTFRAMLDVAERSGSGIEGVCLTAVEEHFASDVVYIPRARRPMPRHGFDVAFEIPHSIWQRARTLAKPADLTVGQILRFAIEDSLSPFASGRRCYLPITDTQGAGRPTCAREDGHAPPLSAPSLVH